MVSHRIHAVLIGLIMGSALKLELCSGGLGVSNSVKLMLEAHAVVLPARHFICGSERVGALCLISFLCFVCALFLDFNMPLHVYLRSPSEIGMFSVSGRPPGLSTGVFGWDNQDSHLGSRYCCLIKCCHAQEHVHAGHSVWLGDYFSWLDIYISIFGRAFWSKTSPIQAQGWAAKKKKGAEI